MSEPVRIQLRRTKGFRLQETSLAVNGLPCVKCDRSTPYGNEFTVEDYGDAETAVDMFDHDLDKFEAFHPDDYATFMDRLRGKNLACWCKLDAPFCHVDVWLRRAKQP